MTENTMTLEQALQIMKKVCGYAFNKAYGADVAMKVVKAHLSRPGSVSDEAVQAAIVAAESYSNATRIGWHAMRAALEADRTSR